MSVNDTVFSSMESVARMSSVQSPMVYRKMLTCSFSDLCANHEAIWYLSNLWHHFLRLAAWPSKVFSRGRLPAWWQTVFSPACCWSSFPGIILDLLQYLCHHLVLFVDTVLLSSGHTGSITMQEQLVAAICLFSKQRKALISGMRITCRVASLEFSEHY